MPVFRHRTELAFPVDTVFGWHKRPGAMERLTPPWISARVREGSPGLEAATRVVLEVGLGPARFTWELEHTEYEEGRRFVDEQVRGPFARWRHEHRFESLGADRTLVEDVVEWSPPLGSLGTTLSEGYVQRSLERFVGFRARRLAGDLSLHDRYGPGEGRTVVVTGSSGFIGTNLVHLLTAGGYRVRHVSRSPDPSEDVIRWDPEKGILDPARLEGVDAVVHLAGESIAGVRWTPSKKGAILRSREEGTLLLARTLAGLARPPEVLVSASGIHYYGDGGEARLTEESPPGEGFLAEVCRRWESAAGPARSAGIRTVHLRNGVVLSPGGGLLGTAHLPFKMGVGGRIGSGRQYMSWIDMDDVTGLILHAIRAEGLRGGVNSTAPSPLPNAAFTDVLGRVVRRPTVVPVPALAVRALLGEMGEELLLSSQRAFPERARASGFRFQFPELEDSLRHQMGSEDDAPQPEDRKNPS